MPAHVCNGFNADMGAKISLIKRHGYFMPNTSKILDYVPQPDEYTCQSACIAMMVGSTDVMGIRRSLLEACTADSQPGSPYIMGNYLDKRVKEYCFHSAASVIDMVNWLSEGFTLITHGYFTNGHVIVVNNHINDCFVVDDPYGEFDAPSWTYTGNKHGDDVPYSERLIYSACVASGGKSEAASIYNGGGIDRGFGNAWVHTIRN